MSPYNYVLGVACTLAILASAGFAAAGVRRWLVPGWSGAPARLAEAILALAFLAGAAEVLGTLGLLTRWVVLAVLVGLGIGIGLVVRRPAVAPPAPVHPVVVAPVDRRQVLLVGLLAAVVTGEWLTRMLPSLVNGARVADSIVYHLPVAARFVQDGRITALHYISPSSPAQFNPANAELIHALGMVSFGRDLLSPLVNLGFLALLLLAAWCAGRPFGVAPVTTGAALLLVGAPLTVYSQAGSAANDIAAVAFVLAAVGFVLTEPRHSQAIVLGGLAAGLAVGTKFTVLGVVGALTVGLLLEAPGGHRARTARLWLVPLATTGSYWYVLNLMRVGGAGLALHLPLLPSPVLPFLDRTGFSVAHYLTDATVWRHWFLPGLGLAFGPAWWLVLSLVTCGIAVGLIRARGIVRVVAVAAAVGVVVYVITPTTALGFPGRPVLFAGNLRYLAPAAALAVLALALGTARSGPQQWAMLGGTAAIIAVNQGVAGPLAAWPTGFTFGSIAILATVAAVFGVALVLAWLGAPVWSRRRALLAGLIALPLIAVAGWPVQVRNDAARYARRDPGLDSAYAWARGVHDARIGIAGFWEQYPLYGLDLSNRVEYVGRKIAHGGFEDLPDCPAWQGALRRGGYRYVVISVAFESDRVEPPQAAWTRTYPGASELLRSRLTTIFQLPSGGTGTGCQ
ncbi:MAG: hypothetical protein WDA71_02865 [Actinomycetota bacterium]